uniref:Reverse transcriptase zinc-binding domain-containing protein n=1 Tax=Amphiprion percula TaxID=161767 RepID=A0A3P8S9J2_AMPPE
MRQSHPPGLSGLKKMAKLKLRDSDLCWRCHRSKGTLLHMLYDCHLTQNLWKTIIGFVNKVLGTKDLVFVEDLPQFFRQSRHIRDHYVVSPVLLLFSSHWVVLLSGSCVSLLYANELQPSPGKHTGSQQETHRNRTSMPHAAHFQL